MKFEIDPNELTFDQRAHVAAFITNWPDAGAEALKNFRPQYHIVPTEEQRLDAEQKNDLEEAAADNLNAIFGTPDIAKQTQENIVEVAANLNSLVPLDKEGLPWDSRIHASTKTFIADGSWKLRRGVDPAEVEKVKAQLKELMAVPKFTDLTSELMNVAFNTPNADNEVAQALVDAAREVPPDGTGYVHLHPDAVIMPIAPAPVLSESGIETPVVTIGSASTVPVPPAPKSHYLIDQPSVNVPVPGIPSPAPVVTLTDLIGRMSKAIAENRLTQANVTEICIKHGVSEFHLLSNRPDLLPLIDTDMKAMGV